MSQQGGSPAGHDDDWWTQLYDDSADDTGPTTAPDSLDDRFASAAGTVARGPDHDLRDGPTPPPSPDRAPSGDREPRGPSPGRPPSGEGEPRGPSPGRPPSGEGEPGGPSWDRPSPADGEPRPAPQGRPTPPPPDRPPSADGRPRPAPPWWTTSAPAGVPAPRTGPPPATDTAPRRPGPPPPRAPWEPPPAVPTGPATFPPTSTGRETGQPVSPRPAAEPPGPEDPPGGRPSPAQPPAAPPSDGNVASAAPVVPPKGGGRRVWLRGRTTSGTGDGDLSEPSAGGSAPVSGGFRPPPPAGAAPGLPPLPPPFLPYDQPEPAPGTGVSDRDYVGSGPPTYDAEPTALPPADPDGLDGLVADTVLDGARYGSCTLRAVSVRGDSARYRGDPRRDALLVARFGAGEQALVLVAMATGARATSGAHLAAAEVCRWIGRAVGRSHARLGEDLRAARRGDLKSGLHRLTDRSLGRLRAGAADQGLSPDEYAATLRCLLLPADPECRTRVYFGVGAGGLLRLRNGTWQNMEPSGGEVTGEPVVGFGSPPAETPEGDRLTMDLGVTTPPGPYYDPPPEPPREPFRFRASVARPGDVLLMCTAGLAEPLLNEPELGELLARRWSGRPAPGLAEFLADSRVRVKGYADDRTAAAVWEA
ncbi:protein phosphatase 2C domain-containing protein [Streptomyces mutabilis]|uniref:protein phosphatase 2C domain-containing protein n=1 Tax=Streptomyces mutabilis TaxID=67332 RepID=UPI00341A6282